MQKLFPAALRNSTYGFLTGKIMPDYLHPNKEGHKIWAEAIEPKMAELMDEKPGK
jgi:lysophospholipase L1-like esterase